MIGTLVAEAAPMNKYVGTERSVLGLRIFLGLVSFFIYAYAILHQGHYLIAQCTHECGAALPAALSFSVYGDRLGTIEKDIRQGFGGSAHQSVERTNQGNLPRGETEISFD